ncbi:unnamed protein product [Porites evermanni]|uniref:Uncharacterized protein n=1 Tax=Porites evermanni TaxID=104178 RepID=A0ABN8LBV3_9CNID|nr:unnamed protein product [Porites evermanni]
MKRVGNGNGVAVAATGAGETQVCLGIIPIKVQGSQKVNSKLVDLLVKSIDDSVEVELCNVKTVVNMPISTSCIASQREDLVRWTHLHGIDIPSIEDGEVSLLIGLKERPTLFLLLELKTGGDNEPIAIQYSLGWTDCHMQQGNLLRDEVSRQRISEETKKLKDENETAQHFKDKMDKMDS